MAQKWTLVFLSGELRGKKVVISSEQNIGIGTGRNMDIVLLRDSQIANFHAQIKDGHLIDMSNTHGTYLNGRKIKEAELVHEGVITIGTTTIKVISNEKRRYTSSNFVELRLPAIIGILSFLTAMMIAYLAPIPDSGRVLEGKNKRLEQWIGLENNPSFEQEGEYGAKWWRPSGSIPLEAVLRTENPSDGLYFLEIRPKQKRTGLFFIQSQKELAVNQNQFYNLSVMARGKGKGTVGIQAKRKSTGVSLYHFASVTEEWQKISLSFKASENDFLEIALSGMGNLQKLCFDDLKVVQGDLKDATSLSSDFAFSNPPFLYSVNSKGTLSACTSQTPLFQNGHFTILTEDKIEIPCFTAISSSANVPEANKVFIQGKIYEPSSDQYIACEYQVEFTGQILQIHTTFTIPSSTCKAVVFSCMIPENVWEETISTIKGNTLYRYQGEFVDGDVEETVLSLLQNRLAFSWGRKCMVEVQQRRNQVWLQCTFFLSQEPQRYTLDFQISQYCKYDEDKIQQWLDEAQKVSILQPLKASQIYGQILAQYPLHPKAAKAQNFRFQLLSSLNQHLSQLLVKNIALPYHDACWLQISTHTAWKNHLRTLSKEKKKELYDFWMGRIEKETTKEENLSLVYNIGIMLRSLAETPEEREKLDTVLLRIQNLLTK